MSEADLDLEFEDFVRAHRAKAVSLAWRLLGGDRAAAEDVAHDAFVRAHRARGSYRAEAALSTWFYRILVRQAHNHRRWRALRERFLGPREEPSAAPVLKDPGLERRIAAALAALSAGQREAFILVHLEGFTVAEAAEVLGKAPGTVKSHLARATASLRSALRDLMEET